MKDPQAVSLAELLENQFQGQVVELARLLKECLWNRHTVNATYIVRQSSGD